MEGVNCETGRVFARSEQQTKLRSEMVHSLGVAGEQLRRAMGEDSRSLREYSKPLDLATSPSPEALQFLSKGFAQNFSTDVATTISLYERAIDIDPACALAYATVGIRYLVTGQATKSIAAESKAYDLRDRLTAQLRFLVETLYHNVGQGDWESTTPIYEKWIKEFPLDGVAHNNYANALLFQGQFQKATIEARSAIRLMPILGSSGYFYSMKGFLLDGRPEEGNAVFDEASSRGMDSEELHLLRHETAFVQNDAQEMAKQLAWLSEHNHEFDAEDLRAMVRRYHGRFDDERNILPGAKNEHGVEGRLVSVLLSTLEQLEAGDESAARRISESPEPLSSFPAEQAIIAFIDVRLGNIKKAEELAKQVNEAAPHDTALQRYALPCIYAAIQLQQHNPSSAIAFLEPVKKYEFVIDAPFNDVYPAYLRGLAFLQMRDGRSASAEFQTVIDHPFTVGRSDIGPLARLQLARARAMEGDKTGARRAYEDFLALWRDAGPKVPALLQAKAEYAALR